MNIFEEDIMRYHNHEAIRDLIKEDFKEWILIKKKMAKEEKVQTQTEFQKRFLNLLIEKGFKNPYT